MESEVVVGVDGGHGGVVMVGHGGVVGIHVVC